MDTAHNLAMDHDNALRLIGQLTIREQANASRIRELETQVKRQNEIIKEDTGNIRRLAEEKGELTQLVENLTKRLKAMETSNGDVSGYPPIVPGHPPTVPQ